MYDNCSTGSSDQCLHFLQNDSQAVEFRSNIDYAVGFGYFYLQTCICVVGFVLNVVNFCVFVRREFTAPAYLLMASLAMADAITLLLRIPQGCLFLQQLGYQANDVVVYVYVYNVYIETPLTNMSENMSAWLTVLLSVERYISMRHWLFAKRYFTRRRTIQMVGLLWLVVVLFNTPYFTIQKLSLTRELGFLEVNSNITAFGLSNYYASYSWLRIGLVQVIPFVFLCVSNCLFFILISEHNRRMEGRSRNYLQSPATKTVKVDRNGDSSEERNGGATEILADRPTNVSLVNYHENGANGDPINRGSSDPTSTDWRPAHHAVQTNKKLRTSKDLQSRNSSDFSPHPTFYERAQRRRSAQNKLTILLIAVIFVFLLGQVPQSFAYLRVFEKLGFCPQNDMQLCSVYRLYRAITVNLALLAFASTFFIYFSLNRDFRRAVGKCQCKDNH